MSQDAAINITFIFRCIPVILTFVCLFAFICYRCRQADIHEHLQQRRSSYNIEYGRNRTGGSASKVDLLKSALEINHKTSHSSMASRGGGDRTSNQSLNRYRADSAPKLNLTNPKALIIPSDPVLEVISCALYSIPFYHRTNKLLGKPKYTNAIRTNKQFQFTVPQ